MLYPLTWIIAIGVYSLFTKYPARKRVTKRLTIVLLLLFTNPLIINLLISSWEVPAVPYNNLPDNFTHAVVLSGVTNINIEPKDRVHYSKGVDRILHAIELVKRGIADTLVISGGNGSLLTPELSESKNLMRTALLAGIPNERIKIESQSRNTYENARYVADLLPEEHNILLVTSGYHMRRAEMCFQKFNIQFTCFSTDIRSASFNSSPDHWLIPKASSIDRWNIIIKEMVGIIMYRLNGYI